MKSLREYIQEKLIINNKLVCHPPYKDLSELTPQIWKSLELKDVSKYYLDENIPDKFDGIMYHYRLGGSICYWFKMWMVCAIYGPNNLSDINERIGATRNDKGPAKCLWEDENVFKYNEETNIIEAVPVSQWNKDK